MEKIIWSRLKRHKNTIIRKRKKEGLQQAVYFSEGILGLKRGEYLKYSPKIKRIIKKFK